MLLYELFDEEQFVANLDVALAQLQNDLQNKKISFDWDVETLQDYLRKYEVNVDVTDLYNMVKQPPMNKVIKNIQGDKVIFKGQEETKVSSKPEGDNKKVVQQMAKSAIKKKK